MTFGNSVPTPVVLNLLLPSLLSLQIVELRMRKGGGRGIGDVYVQTPARHVPKEEEEEEEEHQ